MIPITASLALRLVQGILWQTSYIRHSAKCFISSRKSELVGPEKLLIADGCPRYEFSGH